MNSIIEAWNAMTTEQQLDYLRACIVKATKREIDGDLQHFISFHDLDGLANEAWLKLTDRITDSYLERLNARRTAEGKPKITFNSIVYRAALDAVRKAHRGDKKHEHDALTLCDDDGNEIDRPVYRHTDETEAIALGRLIIEEFASSRDEIDRLIIEAVRDGYTGRETAQAADISAPAITKRLQKLRAALRAEVA